MGLKAAWRTSRLLAVPGEEFVAGRNRKALVELIRLIHCFTGGKVGAPFFMGGRIVGELFGCSHVAGRKRLKALEKLGIVRETATGRLCIDADGRLPQASEWVYLGPSTLQRKVSTYKSGAPAPRTGLGERTTEPEDTAQRRAPPREERKNRTGATEPGARRAVPADSDPVVWAVDAVAGEAEWARSRITDAANAAGWAGRSLSETVPPDTIAGLLGALRARDGTEAHRVLDAIDELEVTHAVRRRDPREDRPVRGAEEPSRQAAVPAL